LIEEVFRDRKKISLDEFTQIIEEVSSEMFLAVKFHILIISYLIDNRSFAILSSLQ
jgi:hypothetical protein